MNTGLEELRERMERATAGLAVPGGLACRAARRRRRRILTRATAAAAAAAVVAGVAIAATTAAPPERGAIASTRLVSDIRSALDAAAADNDIMHMWTPRTPGTPGTPGIPGAPGASVENWSYVAAQETLTRSEASGFDMGSITTSTSKTSIWVNYAAKTVQTTVAKGDLLKEWSSLQTLCGRTSSVSVPSAMTMSADIRQELSCGQLTSEGTENVNGINAIKLVSVFNTHTHTYGVVYGIIWVNPATYLPVRWQLWPNPRDTFDISWLPPTSANLANFRVPIPAGFTHEPLMKV
jgi:hypothetical protein